MRDMAIDDRTLTAMSEWERMDLLQRLVRMQSAPPLMTPRTRLLRRWLLRSLVGACLALMIWIPVLAAELPMQYRAGHWKSAWVGFDVALLCSLGATAWALWRRRQIVVLFAMVSGTLIGADAWFDVLTSSTSADLARSLGLALVLEFPMAIGFFVLAHRLLRLVVLAARASLGVGAPSTLRRTPIFGVATSQDSAA